MSSRLRSAAVTVVLFLTGASFVPGAEGKGQAPADYAPVAAQRAAKVVGALSLADEAQAGRVRSLVAAQYLALHAVQSERDAKVAAARRELADRPARDQAIAAARAAAEARLAERHPRFLADLARELRPDQVEQVKDGMTYGVLQVTYRAYLEMLPNLTDAQKAQIHAWLVEAREHAMDGGTSEEKHQWFGKYKGRINNYLAAAGYDLKQAEREAAARRQRR
jgi:hypothetical protein